MLANLLEQLTLFVETVVLTLGLPGIGLIAIGENLFPPTPSEILYPLAGKMAYDGELTIFGVVLVGVLGTLVASTLWYWLGQRLGEERCRTFIDRYGTLRLGRFELELFNVEQFDRALELFEPVIGLEVHVELGTATKMFSPSPNISGHAEGDEPNTAIGPVDLGLPGMDGQSLVRALRERRQQVPALILTARDSELDIIHALEAGA